MDTTFENTSTTVLAFIKALNEEEFNVAAQYLDDNLVFTGVLGTRNNAAQYMKEMEQKKLKYDIKKVFVNEQDVCLLYDINMGAVTLFGSGWYQLSAGKIHNIRVKKFSSPLCNPGKTSGFLFSGHYLNIFRIRGPIYEGSFWCFRNVFFPLLYKGPATSLKYMWLNRNKFTICISNFYN
eukprot:gene14650-17326_t